jgi:acyl-homoserine-lactone acylase
VFLTFLPTAYPAIITRLFAAAITGAVLTGCTDHSDSGGEGSGPEPLPEPIYSATIARTEFGTPHIEAENWGSLGFGQGYAFAEDRFCVLADQIVKVRSQRARFF